MKTNSYTTLERPVLGLLVSACLALAPCAITAAEPEGDSHFLDLRRTPDAVAAITEAGSIDLQLRADGHWQGGDIEVLTVVKDDGLHVELSAPNAAVKKLHLRWKGAIDPAWKCLGDVWERGYGDLQWGALDGGRSMPWYFLASDGKMTNGYGVMTGPAALCSWKVDAGGISLWADVRCGGMGVKLGKRRLAACTVTCRPGKAGESPFAAAQALCRQMCPKPRLPSQPVYGFNDFYGFFGSNTAANFMRDSTAVIGLAANLKNRPIALIDAGWQVENGENSCSGPAVSWARTSSRFGSSLEELVKHIRALDARPGIWYRPLAAVPQQPPPWRLSRDTKFLDPSVPEVLKQVSADCAHFRSLGFKLIKHDFSTFDIAGRWGIQLDDNSLFSDGWAFADRSRTTAEVILDLYRAMRKGAGDDVLIIGCNTMSHLSAGLFELQRAGDDNGKEWSRTLADGVNCLAFRAPQNGTFYVVDADCMGITPGAGQPWEKNRQWLDLLARSGTSMFASLTTPDLGADQQQAIRAAFAIAAEPQPLGEPLDWMQTRTPARWRLMGKEVQFNW